MNVSKHKSNKTNPNWIKQPPDQIDGKELRERVSKLNLELKNQTKLTEKQLKQLEEEHLPRLEKYEKQLEKLEIETVSAKPMKTPLLCV